MAHTLHARFYADAIAIREDLRKHHLIAIVSEAGAGDVAPIVTACCSCGAREMAAKDDDAVSGWIEHFLGVLRGD